MELTIKIVVVITVFIVFRFLYKKASGSLSLKRLNTISFSYYLLLVTCLIGGSAVYLGFRNHYVLSLIKGDTANKGFLIIAYSLIALPLFILLFNRITGIKNYNSFFESYIKKPVNITPTGEKSVFVITFLFSIICALSVVYTFYHVGYIALFEIIKGNLYLLDAGVIINRQFSGNVLVRNIFAMGFTPVLSYFSYIYYRYTKKNNWKILFLFLFILSVLIKTYDFSKAPIVIYLFYFYFIKVLIGDEINIKNIIKYAVLVIGILLAIYYLIIGYKGELLSFTHGPVSRLMVSQIAGLFMHVQIFPDIHEYLRGASFPKIISTIIGFPSYGQRSGRVVMGVLYPSSVANNSSGVMNTLFAAEAYANFGILGVIIAPIIVAFCLSVIPNFILKQDKNPFTISIYILFTFCYEQALIGGFVDYIYNALLIVLLFVFILMHAMTRKGKIFIRFK